MKKFLKYINSLPIYFTMKHYQTFGDSNSFLKNGELNSAESWDVLREQHPQFSISTDRSEWLLASEAKIKKDGQDGGLIERAENIVKLLKKENLFKIFSVGVGGAGLEYQIKKISPDIKIICSEFAEKNVYLLKKVFIEADQIIQFDIINGDWSGVKNDYFDKNSGLLMYRVDASFSDDEWKKIFKKLHDSKIEKIIFIPSSFLTAKSVWNRKWREIKWFFGKKQILFSGFLRTKKTFESYWDGLYSEELIDFGGIKGFLLKIK